MSKRRHKSMIFAAAIALVMVVQIVVASPVCRCAAVAGAMPCQMPEPEQARPCCGDPAPMTTCSAGMSLGCCASAVAEPADPPGLAADHGSRGFEPVLTRAAVDEVSAEPMRLQVGPRAKLELISGEPIYLLNASLLN